MASEIISWKGRTFNEISSLIKKNEGNKNAENLTGIFKANPLKIYRRERSSAQDICNYRTSLRLSVLDAPGGTTVESSSGNCKGIKTTIDINLTENKSERPGTSAVCFSTAENARRRVRSSGMIRKNYDVTKNNDQYYTNSNQYLEARAKTFDQNQYYNIRKGDRSIQSGANESIFNVYASNGLSHCQKYIFHNEATFTYIWLDNTENTVTIPKGDKYVGEIRDTLKRTMETNNHYYIDTRDDKKVFLIDLDYDKTNEKYIFVHRRGGKVTYPYDGIFDIPRDQQGDRLWEPIDELDRIPLIRFTQNEELLAALGFTYPNNGGTLINRGLSPNLPIDEAGNSNFAAINTQVESISNKKAKLLPLYRQVYYKPSNHKMGVQGGVDSSARITRLKYDTITNNAREYMNSYGKSVGNALAYGVKSGGYTIKDKIGFPTKCTPKFSSFYTDGKRNCAASSTQAIKHHQTINQ